MATQQASYKKYKRGQRQANVETEFVNGMMYTDGAVSDGYVKTLVNFDFTQDGRNALKPRAALTTCEVIVPDMSELDPSKFDEEAFLDTDTAIKYSKETVENGRSLRQFIFGKPDVIDGELQDSGTIWLATSERNIDDFEDVITTSYDLCPEESVSAFYGTSLTEIHSTPLLNDAKTSFPVGAFLGNSFYYFTKAGEGYLNKTEFVDGKYVFHKEVLKPLDTDPSFGLKPKELTASEAVNYGYNMLAYEDAYTFLDKKNASMFQMEGILPYSDVECQHLMMTPRANTRVWFRCNYNAAPKTYKIVWSWKEVSGSDNWTIFHTEEVDFNDSTPKLVADFVVPAKEIMIRCEAYPPVEPETESESESEPESETISVGGYIEATDVDSSNYLEKAQHPGLYYKSGNDYIDVSLTEHFYWSDGESFDLTYTADPAYDSNTTYYYYADPVTVDTANLYNWHTYVKPNPDPRYGYNEGESAPEYHYNEEYFYGDDYDHWNVDLVYDPEIAALYPPYSEFFSNEEEEEVSSDIIFDDIVERAMTVGFDFTLSSDSTTRNSQPDVYDLSTSTGMTSWKNRLVVWGVPKDPNIVFISDLEEPTYFPYPNNSIIYDEPVIAVTELMDNLIVFTKSKIHQVELDDDGVTWKSTVLQSNLYIESWDKHLIQTVRNMLYFKSGNYYYMIVPKAQSTTGELTIAPITTPITDFFNHFQRNVSDVFRNCFKDLDENGDLVIYDPTQPEEDWLNNGLVTYYNFIDYEFIHNFYIYRYRDVYVHFDIIYNVVNRYWKINVYESPHFLYPFRNDATQNGLMAVTSPIQVYNMDDDVTEVKRFVQLFKFDPLTPEDAYIPFDVTIDYTIEHEDATVSSEEITVPAALMRYDPDNELVIVDPMLIREREIPNELLFFVNEDAYVGGFNAIALRDDIYDSVMILKTRMVFPNKQMLDTGYRDANLFINKRYRELQLQINNLDNVDMEFGMDFQIAGEPRNTDFLYEVSQTIDEINQDEGIVYIDATPYLPIPYEDEGERKGEIDKTNAWTIEHSLVPDISHWKVRASVSGKGMAPRLRLFTKNMFNYQLLGINWIYREMNMR